VARNSTKDYEFQISSPIIVNATLSGLSSKAELVLLDANKAAVASFFNGSANDSFTYTFSPGVYYARVVGLGRHKANYQLDVTATSNSYGSTLGNQQFATTLTGSAPNAPVFTATPYSASQVSLSWNSVPTANSYQVEIVSGGRWVQLGSLSGSTTGCSVPGLNANTTYDFDVVATNASGSNWGIQQFATTLAGGFAPGVPVSTATSYSTSQVTAACAIEATWLAPTVLSVVQNLSASYDPVVAADFAEDILSSSNLTNFLTYQGLGSLASTSGVTTLLADDVILDMSYASGHSTLSASTLATNELILDCAFGELFLDNGQYTPPNTTTNGTTASNFTQTMNTLNGLTAINTNANFDWNGNTTLNAEVVSGLAPYGLNQLEAKAGVSGLLPSNLFVL
jgi:hypothetical protein